MYFFFVFDFVFDLTIQNWIELDFIKKFLICFIRELSWFYDPDCRVDRLN